MKYVNKNIDVFFFDFNKFNLIQIKLKKIGDIMLENYLPNKISLALNKIPYKNLCELRLRANSPSIVNIMGENYYLKSDELSKKSENSLTITYGDLQSILQKISNNSMYTINDQLLEGYVTIDRGIRVGVCGELVEIDGRLKTIKNISSINFRFPHFIRNCSLNVYPYIVQDGSIRNTLILSPPGAGKTTFLKDIIYQISSREDLINILVVDERCEISSAFVNDENIKLRNVDIYQKCSKKFGFNNGIRSMKPDVIITDEINIDNDIEIIENALTCGVKVIATIHANSIYDLKNKKSFEYLLNRKLFERFVVLSASDGIGTIEGVFNENLVFLGV